MVTALLAGAVLAAVHHAEVVAHRVGEPYGSLVLAVAVTVIEVALIVTLMIAGAGAAETLRARHGVRGRDPHEQRHRRLVDPGRDAHWIGGLVQCRGRRGVARDRRHAGDTQHGGAEFHDDQPGAGLSPPQLAFAAVTALALCGLFVTSDRSAPGLLSPGDGGRHDHRGPAATPPSASAAWRSLALLLVALVGVVGNAKLVSPTIERGVIAAGLPISVVGVIIAILILSPETVAALRAARRGRMQVSLNLAFGSAMASIGLTIPTIAVASIWLTGPLHLGLGANHIVLLALTCIVTEAHSRPGPRHAAAGRRASRAARGLLVPRGQSVRGIWLAVCVLRLALCAALLAGFVFATGADAQTFFYNEVAKDGRLYVFASATRYEAFTRSNGADIGPVIERPGYGPNGETVVFDSEDAINLYNFKHGLPGESFAKPEESKKSEYPSGKFSGLMFGDYYWFSRQASGSESAAAIRLRSKDSTGLWFRRIYFTYDFTYSESLTTRFRLEANSNGDFTGGDLVPYVKDAYLKWTYKGSQQLTLGIHPTLTFDWLDGFWGLRHIEKTPADLYRLDSSRDFGFTLTARLAMDGLTYAAQFGNESGNGSETQEGKILRFEGAL